MPLLGTHKSCQDTLATARVIAQAGQRWDEGGRKKGVGLRKRENMKQQGLRNWCHKDGKKREESELGVQWMLENDEKMREDKEERPKTSRAVFGQAFVIRFLSGFVWGVASICPSWRWLGSSWVDGVMVMTEREGKSDAEWGKKEVGGGQWWQGLYNDRDSFCTIDSPTRDTDLRLTSRVCSVWC